MPIVTKSTTFTPAHRPELIEKIRAFPAQLEEAVRHLTAEELTTPYLAGEWTVAQNVHHLADSHMNAFIRTKLILTEENPPLKPYDQDVWAALPDGNGADLGSALLILNGLHRRWVKVFESLTEEQWHRIGYHPENGPMTLEAILRSYAPHGEGHLDQIARTLAAKEELKI